VDDVRYLSIAEAAARFRSGALCPVDLVDVLLEAVETDNPRLNAYLTVTAELARAQAQAAARSLGAGRDPGPLAGIPLGLKDLYDVAGVPTTAGSPIPDRRPAAADGEVPARLRAAGAVFLGKHHLHEWALGVTTRNPHFGPCRNPWNTDRAPGGSSGGSGAALAAGLCLGAFGSDTGGSIRIPASLCGVVGLKPTRGRVSLRGVVPLSWSLDHAGPMARTVEDVALLLKAVDAYDPLDPASVDGPREDPTRRLGAGVGGLRVLVPERFFLETSEPEVADAVRAALGALERSGARLEAVSLPGVEGLAATNATMLRADAAAYHADHLRDRPSDVGADVLARLRVGESTSAVDYALARRRGEEWRRRFQALLDDRTLLATPTTPEAAPLIEGTDPVEAAARLTSFTGPFNLTGLPALSVPCGFTRDGLPVGLQLVGRPWADALVLQAGAAYQRATDWHLRRPPAR